MTSAIAQQPVYTPLSPIGSRIDKETGSQRPDVKVVKFEKGNQLDSKNQEQEITHAELPEKNITYSPDGTKNASVYSEDNTLEKERYLEFDHEEQQLVWKEEDPVSGEQTKLPAKQAAQTYGRMDETTQKTAPKGGERLESILGSVQGA